ncbi:MAG: hypothetical protein V7L27_04415 [Nostoc sp.]
MPHALEIVYLELIALALASPFGRRQWGINTGNSCEPELPS